MTILVQRVENASLSIVEDIERKFIGDISTGLVVYIGFAEGDTDQDFDKYATKLVNLRIFEDEQGKMNKAVADCDHGIMLIPNFTLCAKTKKGNRPSFDSAMPPQQANEMFDTFLETLQSKCDKVVGGIFGADMRINQSNQGPINIIYDV